MLQYSSVHKNAKATSSIVESFHFEALWFVSSPRFCLQSNIFTHTISLKLDGADVFCFFLVHSCNVNKYFIF